MSTLRILSATAAALTLSFAATASHASLSVFNNNLAGFNAAAGNPAIAVDFDSPALGDVTGATLNGVKLTGESGNSLFVVNAADTFSPCCGAPYQLPATSGARVLSPGGSQLVLGPDTRQRDGVTFTFTTGVRAFGLDVLFQSLDGFSLVGYDVRDANGASLASNGFISIPAQVGGGSYFLGFVATEATNSIKSVVFFDDDDNDVNPDANIGYDTLRFAPPGGGVPEPATWALMIAGFGLAGAGLRRRRTALS